MKRVGKYLKLDVSSGNIDLELPVKQGLNLDLRADRINSEKLNGFNGEWEKDHVRGTVNGGGTLVNADASSGSVNVRFN